MFETWKKKLTAEMSRADVQQVISSSKKDFQLEVKMLVELIKNGNDKMNLFNEIHEECGNNNFAEIVIENVSSNIVPFEETQHLREMSFDEFKSIIDYIFENSILQVELKETIKQQTQLSDISLDCTFKFLNTLTGWIIIRRYTFNRFKQQLYDMFRFDDQKSSYLWHLYEDRKKELIEVVLLDNIALCKEIKNEISNLIGIFSDIFEEDDEGEEEMEEKN